MTDEKLIDQTNKIALLLQLNEKETMVLHTIVKGMTLKESSRHLKMKIKLVEYYRKKIFEKFCVHDKNAVIDIIKGFASILK